MQNVIGTLAQRFGLRPEQVQAGGGPILQLLREQGGGVDFQQLIARIQGAPSWIDQAKGLPRPGSDAGGGLLGQAASIPGSATGQRQTGLAGVLGKPQDAGLQPDSAAKFVQDVLEPLKSSGGGGTQETVLNPVLALKGLGGGLLGQFLK